MRPVKKVIPFLLCFLFGLTALLPVGTAISALFGYTFRLAGFFGFAIGICILSVCGVIFSLLYTEPIASKCLSALLTVFAPLSLINGEFYLLGSKDLWMVGFTVLAVGCASFLTVKYAKSLTLKIISLTLTAVMILPFVLIDFFTLTFGIFGLNTVVQSVESPNGTYYAQVIDSDQGALGGSTLVQVCKRAEFDAVLFRIEKQPQPVYTGEWGEYKNMQIDWENNNTLTINGIPYKIE